MRKLLFESIFRQPLTELAPSPDDAAVAELAAALGQGARSMPDPAMDASWRFTQSTTPITMSNGSACGSSPRRGTPTC